MPYLNFHSCRIAQPIKGASTGYGPDRKHDGKTYRVIYQRGANGKSHEQAYRYAKGAWSADEASVHCNSHNGSFEAAKDVYVDVFKKDLEKQIVYGVIFEPDMIDAHDEFVTKDDIEESAHDYLIRMRRDTDESRTKLSHTLEIDNRTDIVESYIAPCDFEIDGTLVKEGSWVVAMKIHDEQLWKETEESIVGFSAGGYKTFEEGGE